MAEEDIRHGATVGIMSVNRFVNSIHFYNFVDHRKYLLEHFPGSRTPIIICSSSSGVVLFMDGQSFYYICNPQADSHPIPLSVNQRIPQDRRNANEPIPVHPAIDCPAVISIDKSDPELPVFYISCPIFTDEDFVYRFDTYCSADRKWEWSNDEIDLTSPLIPSSAISCGTTAYWLAEECDLVIYDPVTRMVQELTVPLPNRDRHILHATLGVVMGDCLCASVVRQDSVCLYLFDEDNGEWEDFALLEVRICNPHRWFGTYSSFENRGVIECTMAPTPLRFECLGCQKMQVLLVIDGRLYMWENLPAFPGTTVVLPLDEALVPEERLIVGAVPFVRDGFKISDFVRQII